MFLFRELVLKPDGTLMKEGDLLRNPKLGQTLRRIAANPDVFYNGSLAQDIVDDIAEYGVTQSEPRYIDQTWNIYLKTTR